MNLVELDRRFSLAVRRLAKWRCAYCRRDFSCNPELLHCSHFHSRRLKSVRFDHDNAEALCWRCHGFLDNHPKAHAEWKLGRLGEERYWALHRRANEICKVDPRAIRNLIVEMEQSCKSDSLVC